MFLKLHYFFSGFHQTKNKKMKFLVVFVVLCITGNALSLPTRLTEEQFLSSTDEADSKSVDIVSGYAQVNNLHWNNKKEC